MPPTTPTRCPQPRAESRGETRADATTWRVLPFSDAPMGRQLALSEAMLTALPETRHPALRWYVPREAALVLGNGQKPGLIRPGLAEERGIQAYKRTSGGTAVFASADLLSMDVALPPWHPLTTTDVVEAYRWMGELWAAALHELGAEKARALPTTEVRKISPIAADNPLKLACYGTLSPWEVAVGKRKLVGLCQLRRRPGALYQIGVYLHFDPKALGELLDLANNQRKTLATRLHNATLGLDQAAGRAIPAADVIAAVERTLTTRYGAHLVPSQWTPTEQRETTRLERARFQPIVRPEVVNL